MITGTYEVHGVEFDIEIYHQPAHPETGEDEVWEICKCTPRVPDFAGTELGEMVSTEIYEGMGARKKH